MDSTSSSISTWIGRLRAGDDVAARRLHQAVYQRLARLARRRLGSDSRRWFDEDDVALSAFHAFCRGVEADQFPQLQSRDDLWRLLVRIASCKARDYLRKDRAAKRGGGVVRGESVFERPQSERNAEGIGQVAGGRAPPELGLIVAEQCQELLRVLEDDELAQVAVWKMEGYTDEEIGLRLHCVTRTVERKLARIRHKWKQLMPGVCSTDNGAVDEPSS